MSLEWSTSKRGVWVNGLPSFEKIYFVMERDLHRHKLTHENYCTQHPQSLTVKYVYDQGPLHQRSDEINSPEVVQLRSYAIQLKLDVI
jgi:hypothetical protein